MNPKNMLGRNKALFVVLVLLATIVSVSIPTMSDPVPKTVFGYVDPNSGTAAVAYPGSVVIYIQNRTSEQKDIDVMYEQPPPPQYYWYYASAIEDAITDWNTDDPAIVIVDVEHGTYPGGDRIGYVAYSNATLDSSGSQVFPTVELQMIPIPEVVSYDANHINISWTPLPDPYGLIAGYTVYRSETNASDADWGASPIGGSRNNPITDDYYRDETITGGVTYYYALKVCFKGITDEPWDMTVDNHENQYFGIGSEPITPPASAYTVDYISLTTGPTPNGTLLVNEVLNVGEQVQIWASGYNTSEVPNPYAGTVKVDWSQSISLGMFSTYYGDNTIFTAGYYQGGTTTITGENLTMIDTGDITVNAPKVDYIILTDAPNGTELADVVIDGGDSVTIYASGYNVTADTYVRVVEVTWSETDALGGFSPGIGTSTIFTAGMTPGQTNISGENTSMTPSVYDDFVLYINPPPPQIDQIIITAAPGVTELTTVDLPIGGTVTAYASGYNSTTATYIDLVDVDWSESAGLGSFSPGKGTSTVFTAGFVDGLTTVTAENLTVAPSDTFDINILPPMIDYINLTNVAGVAYKLATQTLNIGLSMMIYASGYNNTGNTYVGLVEVDWTDTPDLGDFNPIKSNSTEFTAGVSEGTTTIRGENSSLGLSDQFTLNVVNFTADYLVIVDELGVELDTVYLNVGKQIAIQAYAYNYTGSTLLGAWEVDWTDSPDLGSFSQDTAKSTTFTAGNAEGTTTITGTDSNLVISDDFTIIINPPQPDFILIVDTAGTGLTEIPDHTVDVGVTITGYAASYNDTAGYIGDVSVTWTVDNSGGTAATTTPTSGNSSDFYSADLGGTAIWTATHGLHTDTVTITINPPTVDFIQIRDEAGGAGNVIDTAEFTLDDVVTDTYYCAVYNNSIGYIEDRPVDWAVTGGIGTVEPTTGQLTLFTATTAGTGTVTADYNGITNSTGTITVNPAPDTTPPVAPTGLKVEVVEIEAGGQLKLTWNANTETDLAGYNIYRSTQNVTGTFVKINTALITDTTYTDIGLTNDQPYYYYITAVDDSDNESPAGATVHNIPVAAEEEEEEEEDMTWLWILIIIIIIIVILILFFLLKKPKPAEMPEVPEEEEKELPPPPGAPAEEEAPLIEEEAPPEEEMPSVEEEAPLEEEKLPEGEGIEKETPPSP